MRDKLNELMHKPAVLSLVVMGVRLSTLGLKFLLTLFIARFMTLESVGVYGLVSAAAIMAPSVLGGGFMVVTSRAAVMCDKAELTASIGQYVRFLTIIYMLILGGALGYAVYAGDVVLTLLIVGLVLLEHVNQDFYALLLNLSRPLAANFMHFCRAGLWAVIFMGVSLFWPEYCTMHWLLGMWLAGNVIALAGVILIARKWPWRNAEMVVSLWRWMRESFVHSRTLYTNGFLQTVGSYLDRFVISLFLGLEMTGVYVLFLSISTALSNLVFTGVIQFARPRMVRAYKESNAVYADIYRRCVRHTLLACVGLGVLAAGVMYVLIPYLDRPLLMEYFHVLWFVLVAFMMTSTMSAQNLVFYSQHRDGLTLRYNIVFMTLMFISNLLLVPFWGIVGAATAAIVSPSVIVILQRRRIKCAHLLNLP